MNHSRALSVEEARSAIHAAVHPVTDIQMLGLHDALGRVLAADILAPMDVPSCDNSAMDGWALRAVDTAGAAASLREIGSALAGRPFTGVFGRGDCVRIMTGAAMPQGADCVIMQEAASREGDTISVPAGLQPGQNVRPAGEDLRRGAIALAAGIRLNSAHLGLLASLGLDSVSVFRRLRVAVLSTGDELQPPGASLSPGQIHDSNRPVLLGLLKRLGCETDDLGMLPDEPARLEAALRHAADSADALVTSGGVSAGDRDYTRQLLSGLGSVHFWSIAMRPGRPMAFGHLHGPRSCLMFALPGNPVATAVAYLQFVRPALLRMMGCAATEPPVLRARARHAMPKKAGRTEYQRGIIQRDEAGISVSLTGPQGSAMLSSLCQADCLVVLSQDQGNVAEGDWVEVILLDGLL